MSGFRVNATLVLSALINKPEMINAHFVTSPQLRDNFAGILSTASSKLKRLNNKPRFLYFTQGDSIKEETQQESYNKLQMILKSSSPKSLEWHHNLARGYGEIGDYENALIQQKWRSVNQKQC
jgi:predicted alpha/beta superfamily hydrolase